MSNLRIDVTANVQGAVTGLEQVRKSTQRTGAAINGATTNMRRMNGQITTSQKNFGRFARGGMQQAGYQIGDYAVQVANGTSKMQAFGQQAPQLLQVFGPIGAVVGAAVAIFAAFAVVMQKTKDAAKAAEVEVISLGTAFNKLERIDVIGLSNKLSAPAIAATAQYAVLIESMREVAEEQRNAALTSIVEEIAPAGAISKLETRFQEISRIRRAIYDQGGRAGDAKYDKALKSQQDILSELSKERALRGIILSIQGSTRSQAAENLAAAMTTLKASGDLTEELKLQLVAYGDQIGVVGQLNSVIKGADSAAVATKAQQASIQRLSDSYRTYASTRVSGAAMVAANEVAVAKITNARVFSSYKQYGGLRVAEAYIAAGELKKVEAQSAAEQLTFIEKLKTAHSVYRWSRISGAAMVADAEGAQAAAANARMLAAYRQFGDSRIAAAWLASTRIEQIQNDIDLPDMSGPLRDFSGVIDNEVSPAMLRLKSVQESVSSAIENGMMSMVDGTQSVKEAFKSMASAIIKDLYRMFVVKRITGFISDMIGGFGGSAPTSSLRPVARPAGLRAMGGQVTGGKSYMVGERGPEMVVPSRNGHVVPNNQVGGGGGVTVIQNNTFGNGVNRAEINAMLPKIVEASKAAVLDAKRRGGSFAGAF